MSAFHQDSEAVGAIRGRQDQPVQTSDVAGGEGVSSADGALSQRKAVKMVGTGKGLSTILCCLCGRPIQPNGANMCGACLKDQVDVTEHIPKKGLVIIQCRRCLRWLTKNDHWSHFELESAPFLALVLKKIPGLSKHELVNAKWIWTEPHSKRLKVLVTIRKEVLNKVMLQQDAVVEFVVSNKQCNTCNKEFTNMIWRAVVQIRQHAAHKRTMLVLEQRILKADAHRKCLSVETVRGGIDVFFGAKHDAAEFVSFLSSVAPVRCKESAKLISTDVKSNIRNSQLTIAVELPLLSRDDLVVLPKGAGNRLQGTLCVVQKVTSVVQCIGPSSGKTADLTSDRYWRSPPDPLLSSNSLVEFVVLDCEPAEVSGVGRGGGGAGGKEGGMRGVPESEVALWEVVVALASDVGSAEDTFAVCTHLGKSSARGRPLEAGDMLVGYDLRGKNFNEALLKGLSGELPDIVLVKRAPPPKSAHSKRRYKLRSLDAAGGGGSGDSRDAAPGPAKRGPGGGKAIHGGGGDEREVAALLEEISLDEDLRAELGIVAEVYPNDDRTFAPTAHAEAEDKSESEEDEGGGQDTNI